MEPVMKKQVVRSPQAPAPIGPYSQAISVEAQRLVFLSGQVGLDPATSSLADGVTAQTHQALDNVKAVLDSAGMTMDHIVKTTIFLADMGDFAVVNGVYDSYFASRPPARSTVQVARLPLGALVEIECVAAS